MKRVKLLLLLAFVALLGCDSEEVFDEIQQLTIDRKLIDDYLAENNISATEIGNTGIRYVINTPGSGPNAQFAESVFAHYTGYFLDGTEFDDSTESDPIDFVIGAGQVVQGWEIGFREFNKGTSATLFLPSKYGYGSNRRGNIPANSVLIFDVRVLDIR
ncbi:MAG TPA: FKBP-type peptidyl-prolyl cis-trans isomerase [Roseivirga sp.]